ncbi:MAG: MaoC family dehydratase N-terminal domain-containing protein [Burkholderiales bacterium]|nr:MaoC family dehydratase N-terminal domain-containing protein [Burkholderiales bacterium]
MTTELDPLRDWIGRTEQRTDFVSAASAASLAATLDRAQPEPLPGTALPPLWHWMYFNPVARASELGPDGHPQRGGFLPPVPLPRRMWAGSRLAFFHPLCIGDEITRDSRIADVSIKQGRSGALVFVTVQHELRNARGLALTEEQDIVYREAPAAGEASAAGQPAPEGAAFERSILPDPVLLFRYSALTFNGHRIHYDRPYATGVEGYPGLVVHGPLIATLLMDLLRRERPEAQVRRFRFKAQRPLFEGRAFALCGAPQPQAERSVSLWARDPDGLLAMQAQADLH